MAEGAEIKGTIKLEAQTKGAEAGIARVGKAMVGLGSMAKSLTAGFLKFTAAGAGLALGFKAFEGIKNFMKGAVAEAKAAQDANEKLQMALMRNKKLTAMEAKRPGLIAGQQKELIALADMQEHTGVQAATTMKNLYASMAQAGFGPANVAKMSKGLEGLLTASKGIGASAGDAKDLGDQIRKYIKFGQISKKSPLAMFFGAEGIAATKSMKSEKARAEYVKNVILKQENRVDAALTTRKGKLFLQEQAYRRLQEIIGGPLMETQAAWASLLHGTSLALEPVISRIAGGLTPAMKSLGDWMVKQSPMFIKWGEGLEKGFVVAQAAVSMGFDKIKLAFDKAWADMFGPTAPMHEAFKPLLEQLQKVSGPIGEAITQVWEKVKGPMLSGYREVEAFIKGEVTFADLKEHLGKVWEVTWSELGTIDWEGLWAKIMVGIDEIDWGAIFDSIGNLAKISWDNAWTFLANATDIILQQIQKINWESIGQAIGEFFGAAITDQGGAAGKEWTIDFSKIQIVMENIDTAITTIVDGLAKGIEDGLRKAFEGFDWIAFLFGGMGPLEGWVRGAVSGVQEVQKAQEAAKKATDLGSYRQMLESQKAAGVAGSKRGIEAQESLAAGLVKAGAMPEDLAKIKVEVLGEEQAKQQLGDTKQKADEIPKDVSINVSANTGAAIAELEALNQRVNAINQKAISAVSVPAMQHGGFVNKPTLAQIGEAGPEMVVPLEKTKHAMSMLQAAAKMIGADKWNIGPYNVADLIDKLEGYQGGQVGAAWNLGQALQALSRGDFSKGVLGGGQNVTMNAPITINGVAAGSEGMVGADVERAMQNSVNELLRQLRKAKDEESRLAYV